MERDLVGRTALVTGAGRNIGRAIALELAAKGANVVVSTRANVEEAERVASEARELGVDAVAVVGDLTAPDTIERLATVAGERFGRVDILVSNAALRPFQPFFELPVEDWLEILDVQLHASFRLAKRFVPAMVEAGWGRIIHITGPDAFAGTPNRAHNVTAKGGLRALTKALAIELGPFGITVNDVAPSGIEVEHDERSHPARTAGAAPVLSGPKSFADIPVGRIGTPEDVAYACGFLASPRAGFYTGTVMCCFGGRLNVA